MSDDDDNVVMGKKLGGEYYEVSILIAHDPPASLFIKDADRKNMNDVVGSHIIWFREYGYSPSLSLSLQKNRTTVNIVVAKKGYPYGVTYGYQQRHYSYILTEFKTP
ncbi:hypothetical protein Taro_033269, partial [Colocasia esculenta]|nr:hypothetical protein [Colocasia esculenta]